MTPPPPPPPYPPPTPPKGSHFMNSGHLWKYQWRKGFVKVNRSPYLHRRIYRTLWKRELLRAWSLVILWKVGCCGTQYFDFFIDSIYRYPYKALWYLIDSPHPPPPPSICSQFSLVLLLTLLETADSPTVPPGNHVIPPPPWKIFFYPTPLAIKMTLPLVSLIIQKLSPKLLNFLNDLLLLTLPLPTI